MSVPLRVIVGRNVKSLRLALGLSVLNFSIVTGLSKASVVTIESGKTGYNLNLLDNIVKFARLSFGDLMNDQYLPIDDFRDKLINYYKNNHEVMGILDQKPEIVYAVRFKLLKTDFINEPREISEIKTFFEKFGWTYLGTSISNTLKRLPEKIRIENHPSKKHTNIYSRIIS